MTLKSITSALVLIAMLALIANNGYIYSYKLNTRRIVKYEARRLVLAKFTSADEITNRKKDAWGNELFYEIQKDPKIITVIVLSSGPDGNIETEGDNIGRIKTNYNKSRIIGEWAGSKLKEGIKGIKDGFMRKSEFE